MANKVTLRRNIEQIRHCVQEALSVVERGENLTCACEDLQHARELIEGVLPVLKRQALAQKD